MDTADIPASGPSDWRREPSERANAILGKLGEEANELAARCSRAMIQGLGQEDPDSGRSNRDHLQDEIADVRAVMVLAVEFLELDRRRLDDRQQRKYIYKRPWIVALPDERCAEGKTND